MNQFTFFWGKGKVYMNGINFIRAIARNCGVTVEETAKGLKSLATNIKIALNDQGSVTLNGLETFKNSIIPEYAEINPIIGEIIQNSIAHVPEFKPVKEFVKQDVKSLSLV